MNDDLERIIIALSNIYPINDPIFERAEQMMDFRSAFKFSHGDDMEDWKNRDRAISSKCGNCGFTWISGFMPMPKRKLNSVRERAAFCVRCCETENILFREVVFRRPNATLEKAPVFKHTGT